jgi:hypothetical protein
MNGAQDRIRLRCSPACAKPLRRRQVLKTSRLRAETHSGVQARNRRMLNETGFVAVTQRPFYRGLRGTIITGQ